MAKLSALTVQQTAEPGRYGDGGGLWLQVRDRDRKSWLFRFTLAGKARQMGLGYAGKGGVGLAEARDAAAAARRLVRLGQDPINARKAGVQAAAEDSARTFRTVADQYIEANTAGWRNAKHRKQWRSTLDTYAVPKLGDLPVAQITTASVTAALEPIWREKPETASRLRGRIEAVIDFATARGWRSGENPARWRGHLANLLPSPRKLARVEHHPALPWGEIGAFMAKLREREGTSARALEFLILTAARTSEVLHARWGEVDLAGAVWIVPEHRTKSQRTHRVPLSPRALQILRQVRPKGDIHADALVFPADRPGRPLSNMALLALLKRMKRTDLTVHGFRSTFRDWAAEATNYPREVAEAALAHALRDKTEAAYQRGDLLAKRAKLMNGWAEHCGRMPASGNVRSLRTVTRR